MMNHFTPDWNNVKPLGRTCPTEGGLWLAFSATGAEFTFRGTTCTVTITGDDRAALPDAGENHARIAMEVNGQRVVSDMVDAPEKTYELCHFDAPQEVTVRVVKLSETSMATCCIRDVAVDAEEIRPTAAKPRRIEVIGDSITCGYGVDDEVPEHPFKTATEDATRAYAYKTAMALGADYSLVSISGYGIISGFTGVGEKIPAQTIPQYYSKLGFCYAACNGRRAEDTAWNHADFRPDIIVINLGTNDDSYCLEYADRQADYCAHYVEFLQDIRRKNPGAQLLCTLGIMGTRLCPQVEKAADTYRQETGDTRIAVMAFEEQLESDGRTSDWHPTARTHDKAAAKLTEKIRDLMNW